MQDFVTKPQTENQMHETEGNRKVTKSKMTSGVYFWNEKKKKTLIQRNFHIQRMNSWLTVHF